MNKHLYRVVFNKKRGQLMAVMETAASDGKTTGTAGGAGSPASTRRVRLRALSLSLLLAFGLATIRPDNAAAQAVAYKAAPASQQPTVLTTANGLPQINIQTPSAAGVSRNTYSQFDVQSRGLIVNNSRTNVATQLGGWVQGNPWLATGTARVILNEVVSGNPSVLNGYLEIAGDRAQLVIANPAGVTCSGCGFVNASRATLTTGTPLMSDGDLAGYRVTGGTVRIDGAGMDASRVDHTDLIARAVEINAGLWAQNLKITAGANQVDAAHTQATPIAGQGAAPAFAIDVAQLGGMYANKILLVGTDAGVGVRNAGTIGAAAGEILVTADGRLENRGTVISGDHPLTITAQGVDNAGTLSSERTLTLTSRGGQGDLLNTGLIHAGQELVLDAAGPLTNRHGTLDGQRLEIRADSLLNDGALRQSGTQALALTAGQVTNSAGALIGNLAPTDAGGGGNGASSSAAGTVSAPTSSGDGAVTVNPTAPARLADGLIAIRGDIANAGTLAASGAVSLTATAGLSNAGTLTLDRLAVTGDSFRNRGAITTVDARLGTPLLDNSGGTLEVARTLDIAARDLLNAQGTLRHTGAEALTLTLEGRLDNREGQIATNAHQLALSAATVDNTAGAITHAGQGALTLATGRLDGNGGTIETLGALTLTITGSAFLDGATTVGDTFALTAGLLSHRGGHLAQTGQGAGTITVAGHLDNRGGAFANAGPLHLTAGDLDNRNGGQIVTNGDLTLAATGGALANDGGTLSSQGALTATVAGDLRNAAGKIVAGTDLALTTGGFLANAAGTLGAVAGRVDATAGGAFDNTGGRVEAATGLALTASGLGNVDGTLLGRALTVDTRQQTIDNTRGTVVADGALTVQSGQIVNTGGLFQAAGALAIDTHGHALTNTAAGSTGGIRGQAAVTLNTGDLDNSAGLIAAAGNLQLTSAALTNAQGRISAEQALQVTVAGHLDNRGGAFANAGPLHLTAGDLDNRNGGQIVTNGDLTLAATGGALANDGGTLSSQGALTATVAGDLRNAAGKIVAGTDLALTTGGILANAAGTLGAVAGRVDATAGGAFDNTGGRVEAATGLALTASGLGNVDGTLLGRALTVDTRQQTIDNTRGTVVADGALTVQSGQIVNTGGLFQAAGALAIDTHGHALTNTAAGSTGGIRGQAAVTLNTGDLDNSAGLIAAAGNLQLTSAALTNVGGRLAAWQQMTLTVGATLDNRSGNIQAGGDLATSAATAVDNSGGLMRAGGTLTVGTAHLVNTDTNAVDHGIEGRAVDLAAYQIDNRGGAVRADDALTIRSAGTLDNTSGLLSSARALTVADESATRTLAVTNTGGTLVAGTQLTLRADRLTGDGRLLSHGDLTLDLNGDFLNTGEITAANNAGVSLAGVLTNSGRLQAGNALTVQAGTLDNTAAGTLTAATLTLKASDTHTLTNRGLIDGGDTVIDAVTLNNLGAGRLYGDHLAIAATTLNNRAENGVAPVIAARDRLDIGAGTLDNRDGALLFSIGDMALGGALDASHRAVGKADSLSNASATIEALGDLMLNATRIENRNEHFMTQLVNVGSVSVDEWAIENGSRYRPNQVSLTWSSTPGVIYNPPAGNGMTYMSDEGFFSDNSNNYIMLTTPDGSSKTFWLYSVTRTTQETQVLSSKPGKITAGGNMTVVAETLRNDNSQILAGGNLTGSFGNIENSGTAGQRIVSDSGTAWSIYIDKDHKDSDRKPDSYNPAPSIETINITVARIEGNTAASGSGTSIAGRNNAGVDQTAAGAGAAQLASGSGANVARSASTGNADTATGPGATVAATAQTAAANPGSAFAPGPDATAQTLAAHPANAFGIAPGAIARVSAAGHGDGPATLIATAAPTLTLPANRLLHRNRAPGSHYLIETDPAFAGYRQWLSSDYLLNALALDPAATQKRLGDGFYEQRLVAEQVAQLTGQRFLAGYPNDEQQYRALLAAGATVARDWRLIPGVALTAAQMAQLTTDIVWLVEKEIVLSDGPPQKVLVPQLYVRVRDGDLTGNGALIAADAIDLKLSGDLQNSATIAGRQLVSLTAQNITHLGTLAARDLVVQAADDLTVRGGTLTAQRTLIATAGRDLSVESTTQSQTGVRSQRTNLDRVAGLYVQGDRENSPGDGDPAGGTLLLAAGRDLTLLAAALVNAAPTAGAATATASDVSALPGVSDAGRTRLAAGRDLTLGTVGTGWSESIGGGKHARQDARATEIGATLQTGGDLTLTAGRDLTLTTGEARLSVAEQHQTRSKSLLSSKKTVTRDTLDTTTALATTVSAERVTLTAGQDLSVTGSAVVATHDTTLAAGRDVAITAATETHNETHYKKTTQSGVFGSGGVGFTIGGRMNSTDQKTDATLAARSTVGSLDGNVSITAGDSYRQTGSELIAAGGDIAVAARRIDITEARDTRRTVTETRSRQSGLTIAFSNPVVSALQTARQMAQAAGDSGDSRMKALAAASTALAVTNAAGALKAGQGSTVELKDGPVRDGQIVTAVDDKGAPVASRDANAADKAGGIGISLSIGRSKSRSKTTEESDTAAGSTLRAGGDITLTARGDGKNSDILVQGGTVTAGKNVTLDADDEIRLLAARNTAEQHSTNSGSSASVGIGFMVGGTQNGFTIQAGVSGSKGKADGKDIAYSNTHLTAGETLTLKSGGDATLKGAVAQGEKVVADIKGKLVVESLQDQSTYDSKQKSLGVSVSLCIPPFCAGAPSTGSVSASQSTISSDFASVTEQSGIKAGDSGFEVKVKGDTTLTGGVIASTQKAIDDQRNLFSTDGVRTVTDIENRAEYTARSVSVNVGTSVSLDGALKPGGTSAGFGKDSGEASSTTKGGISGIAGNTAARTGDAETGIKPVFDPQKVQKTIEAQTAITQTFGSLASKAVGDYAGKQAAELKKQGNEEEARKWDEGGVYRVALHTALGGLAGGAGGALGAAAGATAAPLLNELQDRVASGLKDVGASDSAAMLAGQLISGATAAGIGAAAGGTQGAVTAFNADANNRQLHPDQVKLIQRISGNDAAKAADLQAVLCYLQNCNVDGLNGKTADLQAQALYDAGKRMASSDTQSYLALVQEVKGAGLLSGSFAYVNTPDSVKDSLGLLKGTATASIARYTSNNQKGTLNLPDSPVDNTGDRRTSTDWVETAKGAVKAAASMVNGGESYSPSNTDQATGANALNAALIAGSVVAGKVIGEIGAKGGVDLVGVANSTEGVGLEARSLKLPATDPRLSGSYTLGYTEPNGAVYLQPGLSRAEQVVTLRHEGVHAFLSVPDRAPLAAIRQDFGMWGYQNFSLLRWGEEGLAQGIATRSFSEGLKFAIVNPYGISVPRLGTEALVVTGTMGGIWYGAYRFGKGD